MTNELNFKTIVFGAKSEPDLWDAIYGFWNTLPIDGEIDLTVLNGKPKYQSKINEILKSLYQTNWIHAIWLQNETKIRRTF